MRDQEIMLQYWETWFAELLSLAKQHGITTSDDADLWWDDFGEGKTPHESMEGFLTNHQAQSPPPANAHNPCCVRSASGREATNA